MNEYAPRKFAHPEVLLGRYPPSTLLDTQQGHLVICGSNAVTEQVSPWLQDAHAAVMEAHAIAVDGVEIVVPCFLASRYGETTWGHWMLEILPKIIVAERTFPGLFAFIVPQNIVQDTSDRTYSNSIIESLAAFGILQQRIIPVGAFRIYRFRSLFDTFGMHDRNVPHQLALDVLRSLKLSEKGDANLRKIAVLRRPGDRRSLFNYHSIEGILRTRGYEMVDPLSMSFVDQVDAFRAADIIVGELGSGLANLAFARRRTRVVTIGPLDWHDTYFIPLMQILDLRVVDVRGVSVRVNSNSGIEDGGPANSLYLVPPTEFIVALEAAESLVEADGRGSSKILGRERPNYLGRKIAYIRFGSVFESLPFNAEGLFPPEDELQWSTGESAKISIKPFDSNTKNVWLEVRGIGFVVPERYLFKEVKVFVNGQMVGRFCLQGTCHEFFLVSLDVLTKARHETTVEFFHQSCPSPKSMGISASDDRALGIGLKSLTFFETSTYNYYEDGPSSLSKTSTQLRFLRDTVEGASMIDLLPE